MKPLPSEPIEEVGFMKEQEQALSEHDRERIEIMFGQAAKDRSKAYELKSELDRRGVFEEFENRFLDLFKSGDQ